MQKKSLISLAFAAVVVLYAGFSATVVKEGQEAILTGEVAFNPTDEATNFWTNNAKEYFEKNAVDLNTLVSEAKGDFASVAGKYGHYSMGDSGELSFIVKGQGTIDLVKDKLRAGYLSVKVPNLEDGIKVRLQIGPVFKGSAVRDSISLISYKDYKNQIEWAQVSVAFHELITRDILSKLDMRNLLNKEVEFVGCFTVGRKGLLQITPVELLVK